MPDDDDLLGRLIGARMHSVEFVLDYVQLHFEIRTGGPSSGLAGRTVVSVRESGADGVSLDFAEASLALQPLESEVVGPEIATLQCFADKQWAYWAPGLPPFEAVLN